jgi:CelD/BcsL family acetyltransferase involved in cellulose biosynthesis
LKIELIDSRNELDALAGRWDELANSDPRDGFFRTSGWYLSWLDLVRSDAKPFVVVARDEQGTVIGLAPLCRMTHRDHWLPMTAISIGGREVVSGDYLDYLAEPELRAQVLPAILEFLWKARSDWGLLVLGEIFEDGDLHAVVQSFCEREGLSVRRQEERLCPYIELPATFDEYMAVSFNQKRRKEIKRQTRVIVEDFGAVVDVYVGPEQVSANLETLMQLHTGRWTSANQTGNMGRPGFAEFIRKVCSEPPAGSIPRLYVMNHEQKPVAALLVFQSGQSAFAYSIGRDPNCAISHLSPGYALLVWSIRDSIDQGLRYYDFLRGDERHKTHLTKAARKTLTLMIGRSASANAYLRALDLKDAFKNRFPEWWDRLVTSRDQRLQGGEAHETATAKVAKREPARETENVESDAAV